jgi:general secretion pathway protein G
MKNGGLRMHARRLYGFTLVELVVVILVLGIIAAVVAPRMFDTADDARENVTKKNLAVIRDALELYKSEFGEYPDKSNVGTDLGDFIRGPFPAPKVGNGAGDNNVRSSNADPINNPGGSQGWIYNEATGEFRVNDAAYLSW